MSWNPGANGTLGLEWAPISVGSMTLDAVNKMVATSFDQTTGQAIGNVQTPNIGFGSRGGIYVVEAYDNETCASDAVVAVEAAPNEDVSVGTWVNQAGSGANLYQSIDEGGPALNTADYVRQHGVTSTYTGRLNTATLTLTGKRILGVRLNVYITMGPNSIFSAALNISGVSYKILGDIYGPTSKAGAHWFGNTWTYNPATKKPWTIADVSAFDSTDEYELTASTSAGWTAVDVAVVTMTVYYVTENRLAVGAMDDTASALTVGTPSAPGWNNCTMLTPTGGTWTKDGAGRHLYTVRRISSNGSIIIPFLDTDPSSGLVAPIGRSWDVAVDPTYGQATAMGAALTRMHPFNVRTTGPADSVDSQPYALLTPVTVNTGRNAESEFTGAVGTYGTLRFYVDPGSATANLDVKIKRRSDNVQLGGTYSLTPAVATALPSTNGWRLVKVQLGSSATLAAVQYYVEFSSTTAAGAPWTLIAANTNGVGQAGTFNGTTDAATINAAAENTSADMVVTVATIPTAPASMTIALGSQTVTETVACVTAIPRGDLSWAATALGGSFSRYEIQRSENGGTTWADIAYVTVEAVVAWKDYEGRRGVATTYRIRAVRTDGAFSAWRDGNVAITKPLLSVQSGSGTSPTMHLVTNYNPTQNLAYEYRPMKDYAFNEASEQQLQGAYGRDYQLGANPIENRGITASWTFLVGLDDKNAAGVGWNAYTALRNLARAAIPYVCVLDHHGNRMLAQLSVPSGSEDSTGGADRYLANVSGSEIDATPYIVTVTA